MAVFPDPHLDSRPGAVPIPPAPADVRPEPPRPAANDPSTGVPLRPYAARPVPVLDGLRVVPLGSFAWGGKGAMRRPRVRHDDVLIIVAAGQVRIDLPRAGRDHGSGQMVFIPGGTAFAASASPDAVGQVLLVPSALSSRLSPPLPRQLSAGSATDDLRVEIASQVESLRAESRDTSTAARRSAQLRLGLIAILLGRGGAFGTTPPPGTGPDAPRHQHQVVDAYLALAAREMGRGRTLCDLAGSLGTTTAELDRACRVQRGKSALDLMYDLRLKRATTLLRDTPRDLTSIAAELGYTGAAHLTRAFIAATGLPPERFRGAAGPAT